MDYETRCGCFDAYIHSLSVKVAAAPPGLAEEAVCTARLYFQVYQFSATGKVASVKKAEGGQLIITIAIEFTPELIEIVDDYFFRQSIQGQPKSTRAGA